MRKLDSKYIWGVSIFITALVLRLIYFFQVKSGFPGWDTLTIDPLYHDLWAKQIAGGDLLGSGPFFRAPFYAYFLGLIYAVAGPSLAISKVIQHILGSFSCALIFLFANRYFNKTTAILSGLISAFYWVFIYFEDELLLDSLLILFSILLIWSLIRAAEHPTHKRFFLSGLILGITAITRPTFAVFIPLTLAWLLLYFPRQYKATFIRYSVLLTGCLLMILPVTIRNMAVGDDFVVIASQGGINFYIGNNGYADGKSAIMPEFGATWQYADCEYQAKKESSRLGEKMKPSEVSSFYYKKALKFITDHPFAWTGLTLKKFFYFWNSYEVSNNQNLYFFRRFASVTGLLPPLFFVISPFSILGLWLLFKKSKKYHIIGYFVIIYMLTVIAFFVNSRFRLPVLPFLIILASYGMVWLYDRFRSGDKKSKIKTIIILVILFLFTNLDPFGLSRENFAMSHFSMGNVYLKKGINNKALDEYARAIELAGCVPSAHLNRGIIYFGMLDFENAGLEFQKELKACGGSTEAHNNLSVLYRLDGDAESALREARLSVFESPQHLEAHVNEILALRMMGANNAAYQVADSLTLIFPDYLPGHYFKGKMAVERNDIELAEAEFDFIVSKRSSNILEKYDLSTIYSSQTKYGYKEEKMPGLAYYELGLIEVSRGRIDSALILFENTTRILPDYPDGWANLALAYDHKGLFPEALAAFKRSLDLKPNSPLVLYNLGLTMGKTGYLEKAAEVFGMALELKPDFPEALEKLNITRSLLESSPRQ